MTMYRWTCPRSCCKEQYYLSFHVLTPMNIFIYWNHIITQLLGFVPWDHVSGEKNYPLIPGFPILWGALTLCSMEFSASNYIFKFLQNKIKYANSFFGNSPSSTSLVTLQWLLASTLYYNYGMTTCIERWRKVAIFWWPCALFDFPSRSFMALLVGKRWDCEIRMNWKCMEHNIQ
jgi:hypothetical protein